MRGKTALLVLGLMLVFTLVACSKQSADKEGTQGMSTDTTTNGQTADNSVPPVTGDKAVVDGSATGKTDDKDTKVIANQDTKKPVTGNKGDASKDKQEDKVVVPKVTVVSVPESTIVSTELVDSIDTDVHVTGTEFRVRLMAPVVVDGETVFEEGAMATGIMNKVVESGRMKTPAELTISLVSIEDRSGKQVNIDSYSITEKKDSHTKKQVGLIGGGALVGGIIGKITGKKGGTEAGAVAGAAAGAAAAAATGKQDIVYHSGTQINFVLRSPVSVTVPKEGGVSSTQ